MEYLCTSATFAGSTSLMQILLADFLEHTDCGAPLRMFVWVFPP